MSEINKGRLMSGSMLRNHDRLMNHSLSEQAIREQLTKLLTSEIFARSERLGRFLQFTVDQVLAGKQDELKEYVIGVEVYDRRSPYNPTVDSIVRSEARRLRGKLKQYYEFDGKADPLRIFFRPGSYIPEIRLQEAQVDSSNGTTELNGLMASTSGDVVISVDRIVDLSDTSQATICARGVTVELLHLLMEIKGCRVVAPAPGPFNSAHSYRHLEGDIRQCDSSLRITCRLISAEGFQLATHRLDVSAEAAGSFGLQEEIAARLVSWIASIVRPMTADSRSPLLSRGRIISMAIPEKRTQTDPARLDGSKSPIFSSL
jgi:TolB-like protein